MGTWEKKNHCTTGCIEKELSEPLLTAPQAVTMALKNDELEGCEEIGNSFHGSEDETV